MDLTRVESIAPLVEALVECRNPALRDRVLVEAARVSLRARAIGLWRSVPTLGSDGWSWRPVLTKGPADALPGPAEVEAVVQGSIDGHLDDRRRVVAAPDDGWALAIAGRVDDDGLALVEALFVLAGQIECGHDAIQPPLPEPTPDARPADAAQHDLRNLLTTLGSAFDYVDQFGPELDETETRQVERVLSRDLERIGRLFGDALSEAPSAPGGKSWSPPALIDDVVAALRDELGAAGPALAVGPSDATRPVGLEEGEARDLVEALIRNALAWAGRSGHLEVAWGSAPDDPPGGSRLEVLVDRREEAVRGAGNTNRTALDSLIELASSTRGRFETSVHSGGRVRFAVRWLACPDETRPEPPD